MNQLLALNILEKLARQGVTEYCVCPGARNSPLVDLLLKLPSLTRWHFFEERSAAFFALGRIKATGKPVAIVTTSGTAAGELLPATMEAHYCALPLVLLTADRPKRFRGSGAPQTAEQVGIFGVYSTPTLDIEQDKPFDLPEWRLDRPLHINVCFEEPLLDRSAADLIEKFPLALKNEKIRAQDMRTYNPAPLQTFLEKHRSPLVVVGSLKAEDRAAVKDFLLRFRAPTYLESHSGLREDPALASIRIHCCDGILKRAAAAHFAIDGVLRIGGVPTHRLWRDLEALDGKIPVYSISREPFSGLSWAGIDVAAPGAALSAVACRPITGADALLAKDHSLHEEIRALFVKEPLAEPSLFHALSKTIPERSKVYLGNSLPIREWDMAATFMQKGFEIGANRGLNGIDGQVSTFYGFAESGRENWAMIGDLTALYDLQAPWILSSLPADTTTTLVVINNGGGKIFSRMFEAREFQNPHRMDFSNWAKLWKIGYAEWDDVPDAHSAGMGPHRIIELKPDNDATARFWKSYDALLSSELAPLIK